MASGGTVGDRAAAAVARAFAIAAEPETDGSWHVTMAVPLEAVRQAVAGGARGVPPGGDRGPAVVVVDGVPATAAPAVGWTVGGAAAPALWVHDVPAWAASAPHVTAKRAARGAIEAALPAGAGDATLFVIAR